jgi:hypothetical protein
MSTIPIKSVVALLCVMSAVGVGGLVVAWSSSKPKHGSEVVGGGMTARETPPPSGPIDTINRILVQFSDSQRFGLVCTRLRDPQNPEKPKLLTRDERGLTNNTCIRIEGYEYIFGHEIPGVRWVREKGRIMKEQPIANKDRDRAWQSTMEIEYGRLRITQSVEIVVGENTRLYDTALIKYHLVNNDKVPHTVGLRTMLDTFIGLNDGVPFYIPPVVVGGRETRPAHLVDKMEVFAQKDIPDFVQALESGNLTDANATLAVVGLKIKGYEPIEKMVICRWPQNSEARWGGTGAPGDWVYEPMDKNPNAKDSCLCLYWQQVTMKPGEHRDLAFTYGLGRVMSDGDAGCTISTGRMRLFNNGRNMVGKPITILAYVKTTEADQTVTLQLPPGLTLMPGQSAQRTVPPPGKEGYSQVTWRVMAAKWGEYEVQADAPNIGVAKEKLVVRQESIFD